MGTRRGNKEGSIRKLPDGQYECVIQSTLVNPKTGKPKRFKRKASTKEEALRRASLALKGWENGWTNSGVDRKIQKNRTFGSYMEEFIDTIVRGDLEESGYVSYIRHMRVNFYPYQIASLQLHMLNKQVFANYYNLILEKKSEKTCSLPRQLCVRCCRWLVDEEILDQNYAEQGQRYIDKSIINKQKEEAKKREKNRKKIFTPEDIEKFYYAYENNMGEYPVIVLFLLETGMRAQEFASLKLQNVHLDSGRIDIVESIGYRFKEGEDGKRDKNNGVERFTKDTKTNKDRHIFMSPLCKECVLYMIEQTKLKCKNNPEGYLYPTFRNGKARSNSSMEVCFKDLCNKLGIDRDVRLMPSGAKKGLCLHSLRHTYDSIANSQEGANVYNTAMAMGHSAIRTENIYTHATDEGLKSIITPSQAVLDKYKKETETNKAAVETGSETIDKAREFASLLKDKEFRDTIKELIKELDG